MPVGWPSMKVLNSHCFRDDAPRIEAGLGADGQELPAVRLGPGHGSGCWVAIAARARIARRGKQVGPPPGLSGLPGSCSPIDIGLPPQGRRGVPAVTCSGCGVWRWPHCHERHWIADHAGGHVGAEHEHACEADGRQRHDHQHEDRRDQLRPQRRPVGEPLARTQGGPPARSSRRTGRQVGPLRRVSFRHVRLRHGPGHYDDGSRSTYPTPRRVWISRGSRVSIFRRSTDT